MIETEGIFINRFIAHCNYLLPLFGKKIIRWNEATIKPYILYLHRGKAIDNFFGGLLLEAYLSSRGETLSGRYLGFGKAPTVNAWQEALDELFLSKHNLEAIVNASKSRLFGEPIDIWIALPYPLPSMQSFGMLNRKQLDFRNNPEDRKTALIWWIDQVIQRWTRLTRAHVGHVAQLRGFAWTKGSLDHNDEDVIQALHTHLQGKNLQLIWCTNYGANKAGNGRELGFDRVFIRPTYMNTQDRNENWLTYTANFSSTVPTDLIIWGDERVSKHQLIDFLNIGRVSFTHAHQIFELNDQAVYKFYHTQDPKYVYLYAYTKDAYGYIPTV